MTSHLPPNLLAMFAPRPPLPFAPPLDRELEERRGPTVSGVGEYIKLFGDPPTLPTPITTETKEQRRQGKTLAKMQRGQATAEEESKIWDPNNDPNIKGDAFKTIIVSRLSYQTNEKTLKQLFERFGPIKRIRLVKDKQGKSRGYAFVEFEREKDMKAAHKTSDGSKIDDRRVIVDCERGRTVKDWKPRRLGGGLGGTRLGADSLNIKHAGRVSIGQVSELTGNEERRQDRSRSPSRTKSPPRPARSKERGGRDHPRIDERPGNRERDRDRDRDREKDRDRDRERDRDRDREKDRVHRDRDRDRDRDRRRSRSRSRGRDRSHRDSRPEGRR